MKQLIGSCVDNPFETVEKLENVVEEGEEITKTTFFKHCELSPSIRGDIKQFPNDYKFFKNKNVYFYIHSKIEYFFR